jgi:hypothetical protein
MATLGLNESFQFSHFCSVVLEIALLFCWMLPNQQGQNTIIDSKHNTGQCFKWFTVVLEINTDASLLEVVLPVLVSILILKCTKSIMYIYTGFI